MSFFNILSVPWIGTGCVYSFQLLYIYKNNILENFNQANFLKILNTFLTIYIELDIVGTILKLSGICFTLDLFKFFFWYFILTLLLNSTVYVYINNLVKLNQLRAKNIIFRLHSISNHQNKNVFEANIINSFSTFIFNLKKQFKDSVTSEKRYFQSS